MILLWASIFWSSLSCPHQLSLKHVDLLRYSYYINPSTIHFQHHRFISYCQFYFLFPCVQSHVIPYINFYESISQFMSPIHLLKYLISDIYESFCFIFQMLFLSMSLILYCRCVNDVSISHNNVINSSIISIFSHKNKNIKIHF